jgi:hypothetical protein
MESNYPLLITHEAIRLYEALQQSLKQEAELQQLLMQAIETVDKLNAELATRKS